MTGPERPTASRRSLAEREAPGDPVVVVARRQRARPIARRQLVRAPEAGRP